MLIISRSASLSLGFLFAGLLTACGGSSSNQSTETFLDERLLPLFDSTTIGTANCPPLRGDEGTSAIAGLYISTEMNTGGQDGISYISVSTTGDIVEYVFDENNACFGVDIIGDFFLRPFGGDEYQQVEYANTEQDCTFEISEPFEIVRTETRLTFGENPTDPASDFLDIASEMSPEELTLCAM